VLRPGKRQPVRVLGDKRGPVTRPGCQTCWGTFGAGAESVSTERAQLCEKSHAVGALPLPLKG
jgi:hypothetical protein